MRKFLQLLLLKPVLWASSRFASRPQKVKIHTALTKLCRDITTRNTKNPSLLLFGHSEKYIVFSDQHKGGKNGADDFMNAEKTYLAALDHYYTDNYKFISLGDSEELWENSLSRVKKHNKLSFESEKRFVVANRFYKVFGNHDLYWINDPFAWWQLKNIYGIDVRIYEGLVLRLTVDDRPFDILLTHGHQGDASSDGNWFSKFFVARIWAPLQAYLKINPNTPAYDEQKKTAHNHIMYEWSSLQNDRILITGHTHQPVFGSLTHLERLYKKVLVARKAGNLKEVEETEIEIRKREREYRSVSIDYLQMLPSYFNTGCCCYRDGDITGIEITFEKITLVKWTPDGKRQSLEEITLSELATLLRQRESLTIKTGN